MMFRGIGGGCPILICRLPKARDASTASGRRTGGIMGLVSTLKAVAGSSGRTIRGTEGTCRGLATGSGICIAGCSGLGGTRRGLRGLRGGSGR